MAAAVTLLTKLQSDVRYAEGEVLHLLTQNTDVQDVRVNQLQAYVIPTSQNVVRGGTYSARVILAAVDSTQRPSIYIAGEKQPDNAEGWFETVCNRTGEFFWMVIWSWRKGMAKCFAESSHRNIRWLNLLLRFQLQ